MKDDAVIKDLVIQITDFPIKTYSAFRLWTQNAKALFPDWEPEVENEGVLIEDMIGHIQKSLTALFDKKNDVKRNNIFGWSEGFILGYIQGSLSVTWTIRYAPKPKAYYQALWLKALRQYFQVHQRAAIDVHRLYTHMNLSDMLINEAPYEEDGNFTDFYNLMADQNFLSESKHLTQLLNQLELEYLTKFVKNRPDIKLDGFSKIFPYEDFTSLLDKIDTQKE